MRKNRSVVCLAVIAAPAFTSTACRAAGENAPPAAPPASTAAPAAATPAPAPNPSLSDRIAEPERQLNELKSERAAGQPAASGPEPAPQTAEPAAAQTATAAPAAPAAAPVPTGLAGLLGPTTISAFADTYYGYNSNQPASRTTALRNFDINSGQFVTPAGAEVIESKDNWNYSRSLLFSWAIPYFHFGVNAKYAFNAKFSATGYLVNGWNNSVDNNTGKTGSFSAAWVPNTKWSLIETYLVGPEHTNDNSDFRNLTDTVLAYTPNAKLSLMANFDYGADRFVNTTTPPFVLGPKAHWDGIAGYINHSTALSGNQQDGHRRLDLRVQQCRR
jgi:Putative beta-barrel porin-2, OmpL-like. bbp2